MSIMSHFFRTVKYHWYLRVPLAFCRFTAEFSPEIGKGDRVEVEMSGEGCSRGLASLWNGYEFLFGICAGSPSESTRLTGLVSY